MKLRNVGLVVLLCAGVFVAGYLCRSSLSRDEKCISTPTQIPLVDLIRQSMPAVVLMRGFSPNPGGYFDIGVGSGAIIHEDGYILTANHVARDNLGIPNEAYLDNGEMYYYSIVKRVGDDIAIVKIDAGKPLPTLPMGSSSDLVLGDAALVIGNPSGLGRSVSSGIISGFNRSGQDVSIPGSLQTDAAVNGGNSGGPLINSRGQEVAVVQARLETADNIGFAIPIDRIRQLCAEKAIDRSEGTWLGMTLDFSGPPRVTEVESDSPAAKAGVMVGDLVRSAGGLRVHDTMHFYIALFGKKIGDTVPMEIERDGSPLQLSVTLECVPMRAPEKLADLTAGLNYAMYEGTWKQLPDFDKLTPTKTGKTDTPMPEPCKAMTTPFALRCTGYVEVPFDGVWTFYTNSDDGSQLWIGDELVVDNDGLHGMLEKSGTIALKAGKHPVTILFFEGGGAKGLEVSYQGPQTNKQPIPATAFFGQP